MGYLESPQFINYFQRMSGQLRRYKRVAAGLDGEGKRPLAGIIRSVGSNRPPHRLPGQKTQYRKIRKIQARPSWRKKLFGRRKWQ